MRQGAGKYDRRVTIQQLVTTSDGTGGTTSSWQTFATVWAAIEPLTGGEYFVAQQTTSKVNNKISLRYLDGVKPAMRVLYGTRIYNIEAVMDSEGRRRERQLLCTEVV